MLVFLNRLVIFLIFGPWYVNVVQTFLFFSFFLCASSVVLYLLVKFLVYALRNVVVFSY